MNITEVRVKLMEDPQERLLAFCSITLEDAFVIRDLKIIQGESSPFVAMPSRKLTSRCPSCSNKNGLRANFCEQCGADLRAYRERTPQGRVKLYADIAHPINARCRKDLEEKIIAAFEREVAESQKPDYVCRYEDFGEENYVGGRSAPDRRNAVGPASRNHESATSHT